MKKFIALLLALIMAFSVTTVAFAANETVETEPIATADEVKDTSDERTFGDLGWTEQEINDFVSYPPAGVVSNGAKIELKIVGAVIKIARAFGKIYLTPIKNAFLEWAADIIEHILKKHQPVDDTVKVTLDSSAVSYFANKGETVTLKLNISAEPKTDVKYIEIGGKLYPLTKTGEDSYEADVSVPDKAGVQNLTITGVGLENGKTVKTEYTVTVDVLKAKPAVEDFKIDSSKETPEISFRLSDPDDAFKQGYLVVTNSAGDEVLREIIFANVNHVFTLRMYEGEAYSFNFIITYDLDHDYFDADTAGDQLVIDDTVFDKDITFTRDFNFIASDFALTERVSDGEDLVLTFKNGYNSYYKVS